MFRALRSCMPIALALAACAGDDPGEAPTISNLTYSPDMMTVGQQTILNGNVGFHDPDADLAEMGFVLHLPSGTQQSAPTAPVQNTTGQVDGAIGIALGVIAPEPGHYTFEIWVVDEAGNESNRLTGAADAN